MAAGERCPCSQSPLSGRTRCKLHGGATPRGKASPHWIHGQRSIETRKGREALRWSLEQTQRWMRADQSSMILAMMADLHARLTLAEQALFGESRDWFDLVPEPGERLLAAFSAEAWADARRQEEDDEST